MTALVTVSTSPDDLLDGARNIRLGSINTCHWLTGWIPAATFLEWARRGLVEGEAYGLGNAITYAKRAAACRIDLLLKYNHLVPFWGSNYPRKVDALRDLGLGIPDAVHELVIGPRNVIEHQYERPDAVAARHAVDVAELFVRATDEEYQRASIVAVDWNAMGAYALHLTSGQEAIKFREFGERPMLFVDVFEEPHSAKIVDPANREIRSASLSSFREEQSLELARILRRNYSHGSLYRSGASTTYYLEMKRQGGF